MFNDVNFQGNANDYPWHGRFNRKQIFADFCFSTFADFQGQYILLVISYTLYRFTTAIFVSLPLGAAMLGIGGMGIEQCDPNVKQVIDLLLSFSSR